MSVSPASQPVRGSRWSRRRIKQLKPLIGFWADDRGVGTVMMLFWLLVLVAFAGLAVDTTDGLRNRTILQATADAAALAGAIDLPDPPKARATAVHYAQDNMPPQVNGHVLDVRDVHVGRWDAETQTLDLASPDPDAVMVTTWRGEANANPLPVTFLRILGMEAWNVRAQAVAQRYIPACLRNGLIARNMVDISSNNHFGGKICVHGKNGVNLQSNNTFDPGVTVSMYDIGTLEMPASGFRSNDGLSDALRETGLDPRMVNQVDEFLLGFLDAASPLQPSYIDQSATVIEVDDKFDLGSVEPGRIYHVQCEPNRKVQVPANVEIHNVVIIADCRISIGADAYIHDAVIGSRSGGNGDVAKANINVAANARLGVADGCADGGGVQLFSNATIHTAATTTISGVQIVAKGDIELGARGRGINGISAQAGRDIRLTSKNQFGRCQGGVPDLFPVWYYRLVL